MTEETNNSISDELPPELVDALKAREMPSGVITSRVDREIEQLAAAHFAARPADQPGHHPAGGLKRRPNRQRVALAIAASLVVAVGVGLILPGRDSAPTRDDLYTDVDGSGRIDIADVLALARDGKGISPDDLDAFAESVVRLDVSPDEGDAS